jgi:hypothetical protein
MRADEEEPAAVPLIQVGRGRRNRRQRRGMVSYFDPHSVFEGLHSELEMRLAGVADVTAELGDDDPGVWNKGFPLPDSQLRTDQHPDGHQPMRAVLQFLAKVPTGADESLVGRGVGHGSSSHQQDAVRGSLTTSRVALPSTDWTQTRLERNRFECNVGN